MLTRLLKADNVCDIGHVDSTFQLKTGPSSSIQRGLIFLHHELCLLLVRVEILAAEKNSLKKVDVVLRRLSTGGSFVGNDSAQKNSECGPSDVPLFHYPCRCLPLPLGRCQTEEDFQRYPSSEPSSHPPARKDQPLLQPDTPYEWRHWQSQALIEYSRLHELYPPGVVRLLIAFVAPKKAISGLI